jgi:predicted metal-dependent peptidase
MEKSNKNQKCDQDLIEHPIMEMISDKDFDGYLLTRFDVKVVASLPGDMQTAALIYQDGRFFIRVAEQFMQELKPEERVAVLKHEIAHFVNKHYCRRNGRNFKVWNIAADCAINQNLQHLPSACVTLEKGWPAQEAAEIYYDLYMQMAAKQEKNKKGSQKGDANNDSGPLPGQFDEVMDAPMNGAADAESMADDIIRETIKERLNAGESAERMRGLHAGMLSGYIDDLTKPPMINWKQALARFAASLADAETRRTLKRPDRRELSPFGKKREYLPSLVVVVDTSGSVSDEMLAMFFSQIHLLRNMLNEVEVVIADAQVHESFTYKSGMENSLKNAAVGRGGTDFDPAVKYINTNLSHCDGAVYLTDGWCPVPSTKCRIPMIWIVTENEGYEGRPKIHAADENSKHKRGRW